MGCKMVKDLLTDYIDEELNQELRSEITRHLDSCSSCRELNESLNLLTGQFRQIPREEAPGRIWGQIREAITTKEKKHFLPTGLVEKKKKPTGKR